MFGYIRPKRDDMTAMDWHDYRATYCGLCKALKTEYGEMPRFLITYEMVCLLSLLQALQPDAQFAGWVDNRCIIHPWCQHKETAPSPLNRFGATLTLLLVDGVLRDAQIDKDKKRAKLITPFLQNQFTRARANAPDLERLISHALTKQNEFEKGQSQPDEKTPFEAIKPFADLMGSLFVAGAKVVNIENQAVVEALRLLGQDVGAVIYLLDAIDDWTKDKHNDSWNPFSFCQKRSEVVELATAILPKFEASIDRTAAVLPYHCAGGLMEAIFYRTMPRIRQEVCEGRSKSVGLLGRKNHAKSI